MGNLLIIKSKKKKLITLNINDNSLKELYTFLNLSFYILYIFLLLYYRFCI